MSTQWTKGRRKAEGIAEDAWNHLVSAIETAGDTARSAGGTAKHFGGKARGKAYDLADEAGSRYDAAYDRVGNAADEAWTRAGRAYDALAGRKPGKPWGLIALAVFGGIAVGWAVAASAPKAVQAAVDKLNAEDEPDNPTPTGTTTAYETPAAARTVDGAPSGPPTV